MSDSNQAQLSEPPAPVVPAPILGKFHTTEDLANAYVALEKKLGAPKEPAANPAAVVAPVVAAPQAPSVVAPVVSAPATPQTVIDKYAEEFSKTGALTPESYTALETAGFPKAVVDNYISGQQASQAATRAEVLSVVGGEDAYGEIVTWAASALNETERTAYNTAINSPDKAQVKLVVAGLKARYAAENGNAPSLISATSKAPTGVTGFADGREMITAINDPRYKSDKAYRAAVTARIDAMK